MSKNAKKSTATHRGAMRELANAASDLGNEFALATANSTNAGELATGARSAENLSAQIAGLQSMAGLTARMMVRDVVAKVRERIRAIKDSLRQIDRQNDDIEKAEAAAEKTLIDAAIAEVSGKTRERIVKAFEDVWSVDDRIRGADDSPEYTAAIVQETIDHRGKPRFIELKGAALMRHLDEEGGSNSDVKIRVIPRMMAVEFMHRLVEIPAGELDAMRERRRTLESNHEAFQKLEEMRAGYEAEIAPDRQAELQETFETGTVLGTVGSTTKAKFQDIALRAADTVMRGMEDRIGILDIEAAEIVA